MNPIKSTLDPENLPTLTQEQLELIDRLGDDDIDYSDIPEIPADFYYDQ